MKARNSIGIILILLIVGTYFLANAIQHDQVTGYGKLDPLPSTTLHFQILLQILYLSLACAGVAFLAAFSHWKKTKLFWSIIASLILLIAYEGIVGASLHGRYVDCLVPLLIIGAFTYEWKEDRRILAVGSGLMFFSFLSINMFWRDTINSSSNIYTFYPWLIPLIFVISLIFLLKVKNKKIFVTTLFIVLFVTFVISNTVNFQYLNQSSDNAYENSKIGRYINDNNIQNITFDEDDYRNWWASYCLLCYYYGDFIPLESNSSDYFISSQNLSHEVLVVQDQFKILEENTDKELYLYKKEK